MAQKSLIARTTLRLAEKFNPEIGITRFLLSENAAQLKTALADIDEYRKRLASVSDELQDTSSTVEHLENALKDALHHRFLAEVAVEKATYSPTVLPREGLKCMPFRLGNITAVIYGGPFRNIPTAIHGVKMAAEVKKPCAIDIPTIDFSVPDMETFRMGLLKAVLYLRKHSELYAGCMGGIGRTGLFMAGMAKIMEAAGEHLDLGPVGAYGYNLPNPVVYVRHTYYEHAIETEDQIRLIDNLKVDDIIQTLKDTGILQ